MSTPTLKSIELRNVHGIRYLKMDLGQITIIRGANGTGKSSIIDGIVGTFRGGYDPAWVRDPDAPGAGSIIIGEPPLEKKALGAAKGRSTITLSDGSYIVRNADREQKSSEVKYYSASGEELGGQRVLEQLAPVAAFDPVSFLRAEPKERQKIIMKFLRAEITEKELQEAVGDDWFLTHFKASDGAFANIDRIEKAARERRTLVGREKTSVEKTVENLQGGVPTINQDSAQVKRSAEEAQAQAQLIRREYDAALASVSAEALKERQRVWSETDSESAAVDAWLRAEIALLEEKARTKKAEIGNKREVQIAAVMENAQKADEYVRQKYEEPLSIAEEEHRRAKDALDTYNRADGLRLHLAQERERYEGLLKEHNALESVIADLIALRKKKMENVPIPGLEMRDGVIRYDGLPLDGAINVAKQIELALQIAALSTKTEGIPFMILDEAEHLDNGTLERFLEAAVSAGFQVVYATVEKQQGTPLTVETRQGGGA